MFQVDECFGQKMYIAEFENMSQALKMIDERVSEVCQLIKNSSGPYDDGLLDMADYLMGLGFVILQRFLNDTCRYTDAKLKDVLDIGPRDDNGDCLARIINACADWWKHEPQWDDLNKPQSRTKKPILKLVGADGVEFAMSNVLASFTPEKDLSFVSLIPLMESWGKAVYERFGFRYLDE